MNTILGQWRYRCQSVAEWISVRSLLGGSKGKASLALRFPLLYDFHSQTWSEWVTEAKVEFTEAKVERPGARRLAAFCSDMSTQDIYALEVDFP